MDASQLPQVEQDPAALDWAARYAPIIYADVREPFSIVAAGYTLFEREGDSPSFSGPRRVEWQGVGYAAQSAIEYALWWDWDIGHAYELEHAWVYIGSRKEVVAVEASWHGMFGPAEVNGQPVVLKSHPILFAQPGKHAMAASSEPFAEIREWAEQETGPEAGKGGILEATLFRGRLPKTPENDAKATAYLKKLAFRPAWKFDRRMPVTRPMLIPWTSMERWIPDRVAWCLAQI
jgi:hypothetical protein